MCPLGYLRCMYQHFAFILPDNSPQTTFLYYSKSHKQEPLLTLWSIFFQSFLMYMYFIRVEVTLYMLF